jgi:uncharacterized protein YraI
MRFRQLALGAITASLVAIPAIAHAAWGQATGSVNMRTCASTNCAKITTIPAGARVWVSGSQGGWYQVSFNGASGFASGRYIATAGFGGPGPGPGYGGWQGPPPPFGYWRKPWWDNRHNAWYDGRRWYRNGIWYNDPSGFSFGFSFGR